MTAGSDVTVPYVPKLRNMLVTSSYADGMKLSRRLGKHGGPHFMDSNPDFLIAWPGMALQGYRAANIIIPTEIMERIELSPRLRQWWIEVALTRIAPGGTVIVI